MLFASDTINTWNPDLNSSSFYYTTKELVTKVEKKKHLNPSQYKTFDNLKENVFIPIQANILSRKG